jgi:hypothetical protein
MAADRYMLIRAMALAAKKSASAGKTPIQVLEDIVVGKFTTEFSDGRTVISTSEAGGSTTFAVVPDMGPNDIVALAMETIGWINEQADPVNYETTPRRIKRLRVSFAKAVTS